MSMHPITNDFYLLRKLLQTATGLKVYKSEISSLSSFSSFNLYRGMVQEYKEEKSPHITVAQGSWSIANGGEYKVSLYTPPIVLGNKAIINTGFVRRVAEQIVEALNTEFGEKCWNTCNEEERVWKPLSRNSFYLQIPNFEHYE